MKRTNARPRDAFTSSSTASGTAASKPRDSGPGRSVGISVRTWLLKSNGEGWSRQLSRSGAMASSPRRSEKKSNRPATERVADVNTTVLTRS